MRHLQKQGRRKALTLLLALAAAHYIGALRRKEVGRSLHMAAGASGAADGVKTRRGAARARHSPWRAI